MSDADRIRVTFQDLNDAQSVNLVYMAHGTNSTVLTGFEALIANVTVNHVVMLRQDSSVVGPSVASGSSGSYPLASDMCTLEFTCADGSKQPVSFSGPIAAAFGADHITVDPTQTDIAALIVEILSYVTNAAGSALVEYNRGWRWSLTE